MLRFRAGQGAYVHLAHAIEPARVIEELSLRVWIKSNRSGLQVYARVVLPRTQDRRGQPLTALIPGDAYREVGSWQQLQVTEIPRELDRQVRILRVQFGSQVDPREAYIDLAVLNAYGGAGVTSVWMDDLELLGYAAATPIQTASSIAGSSRTRLVSTQTSVQEGAPAASRVCLQGSVLVVDGRPFFARVIEHQGESLEWLQSLGCNVIRLAAPPNAAQCSEAERFGFWFLAPPPRVEETPPGMAGSERVLAWVLGDHLTSRDVTAVRQLSVQLRAGQPAASRPLLGGVSSGFSAYHDLLDVALVDRPVLGTSSPLDGYAALFRDAVQQSRPSAPLWAVIPTQLPAPLREQIAALSFGVGQSAGVEPWQVRLLAAEAIAAGARGLCFSSDSRLDAPGDAAGLRQATLRWMNHVLSLIEPWAAGGFSVEELAVADPQLRARVLETQRARLIVIAHHAVHQQLVTSPYRSAISSFVVRGTPITDQAYQLLPTGLQPLQTTRGSGTHVPLDDAHAVAMVLFTQDPLVTNHVRQLVANGGGDAAQCQQRIAELALNQTEEVNGQLASLGQVLPGTDSPLTQARASLQHAESLLRAGDTPNAYRAADSVMQAVCQVRRAHWERAVRSFPSPFASPLLATFSTLPLHWKLASRLSAANWRTNVLAGGDFESLEHMLGSGWRQSRSHDSGAETVVELSFAAPRSGRSALHLQARRGDDSARGRSEACPVLITSAPVPVQQGQLVCVRGWVRVPQPIRSSPDGLMIYDSFAGPDFAARISVTSGWQEFTLYRAATRTAEMTLSLDLTGLGEVWLDDISIALLD